jgi:DUF971 family protein
MNIPLFVCRIWQKDSYTFSIEWNDGCIQNFRLSDLQSNCPCANCFDEITGKSLLNPKNISEQVKAIVIRSVGSYGLQIQFTSGCCTGIFSFESLRKMVKPT